MIYNNFKSVVIRELTRIFSRPLYLLSTVGTMTLIYVFFFTLMREGVPENLSIGVVDLDKSTISRRIIREVDAMPDVKVTGYYESFGEARDAMQRGKIFSFLVIPEDTYKEILEFRRPHLSYYVNQGYLLGGTLSMKELMTLTNLAPAAVQRELLRAKGKNEREIMGIIQPVVIDSHFIGNPYANYPIYLLTTIFPGILGLIILLTTTYAIGIELKDATSHEWLDVAGGSIRTALFGKLLPYTILYMLLGLAGLSCMYLWMHYPMNGNLGYYMIGYLLYIISMQAIGIFLIGITPVLRDAVCYSTLYGILAVTMSGFTFPVSAMTPALQGLSWLFPLRQFYLFTADVSLLGCTPNETIGYLMIIALFCLLPFTVIRRLNKALIYQNLPRK